MGNLVSALSPLPLKFYLKVHLEKLGITLHFFFKSRNIIQPHGNYGSHEKVAHRPPTTGSIID